MYANPIFTILISYNYTIIGDIHGYPLDHHNDGHNCGDNAEDTGAHFARGALESLDVLATRASRDTRAHGARWANGIAATAAGGGWMGGLVGVLGHRHDCHGLDRNKGDS